MKRLIIGAVIAVAMIHACAQIGGAKSLNPDTVDAAIIPKGAIMTIQLDTAMNTCFTKKGEIVEFHTVADVVVNSQILIPIHSLIHCKIKKSKGSRSMGRRAEIQLLLTDVKLPDGTILPFKGDIIRMGTDALRDSTLTGEAGKGGAGTAIMGGAMQGAFIGMIASGFNSNRLLYATTAGAAAGAAVPVIDAVFQRGSELDVPANTMFQARFEKPLQIPHQSVIAQNSPATISTAGSDAATSNAVATKPTEAKGIGQADQPMSIAPVSKPDPNAVPLTATISTEEVMKKSSSALTHSEYTPRLKRTQISKPEASPIETAGNGYNIRVQVKMVQVDAIVRDHSGHIIPSLASKDFKVYDNNVLQELAGFSQDKIPLAVAIVVDHSGSVMPYISQLRYIASRALSNLKEQDEVCLFAFDQNVQLIEGLTADRQRIAFAIERIGGGGSTNILDSLYEATGYLADEAPNRRHAVILISDNQQTVWSRAGEQDIIKIAQEKDVVVYSLKTGALLPPSYLLSRNAQPAVLPSGNHLPSILTLGNPLQFMTPFGNPQPFITSGDPVSKVTRDSGGEVIPVTDVESLDAALNTVISNLRTSYSLGYYPSDSQSGAFHSISVRLADKFGKAGSDYSIQAKKGYYAVQSTDR